MFEVLSIFLREGIEMVLLLGIIILYLEKTKRHKQIKFAYSGVISAIIVSIITGIILNSFKAKFSALAEAILFFVTALFVLTLIFWFHYGSKHLTHGLSHRMEHAMSKWQNIGIFAFTFLIIFREGAEIALLMITLDTTNAWSVYIEALIGTLIVFFLGYFLIKGTFKINIRKFYKLTTIMLLFIFAELLIHGLFELMESHIINFGSAIFNIFEFLIDGAGRYIFSGILLILLIMLFVNVWTGKK